MKEGIIYPVKEKQIQPNGIDLELNKVFSLVTFPYISDFLNLRNENLGLFLSNDHKETCNAVEMRPFGDGHFLLRKLVPYQIETSQHVELPEGVCGKIIGRSTLNRNGVIVLSSWYDSGFNNYVGFTIYPFFDIVLEKEVRVAQMIFFESEKGHLYNGQYNESKLS